MTFDPPSLDLDEADVSAFAERHRLRGDPAGGLDLDLVGPAALVEAVEPEFTKYVGVGPGDFLAVVHEADLSTGHAVFTAPCLGDDRAADEAPAEQVIVLVVDPRAGFPLRKQDHQLFGLGKRRHLLVAALDGFQRAGWARLFRPRAGPALIEQMGIEDPLLRKLQLFVPVDRAIGAGSDDLLLPLCLYRIDDNDAVGPLVDSAVAAGGDAGRIVAVIAHHGEVMHVGHRIFSALAAHDVDPLVSVQRLGRGVAGEVVSNVLVLGGQEAVAAILAFGHVDDHVPLRHHLPSLR